MKVALVVTEPGAPNVPLLTTVPLTAIEASESSTTYVRCAVTLLCPDTVTIWRNSTVPLGTPLAGALGTFQYQVDDPVGYAAPLEYFAPATAAAVYPVIKPLLSTLAAPDSAIELAPAVALDATVSTEFDKLPAALGAKVSVTAHCEPAASVPGSAEVPQLLAEMVTPAAALAESILGTIALRLPVPVLANAKLSWFDWPTGTVPKFAVELAVRVAIAVRPTPVRGTCVLLTLVDNAKVPARVPDVEGANLRLMLQDPFAATVAQPLETML